jgi:hypothetical protein
MKIAFGRKLVKRVLILAGVMVLGAVLQAGAGPQAEQRAKDGESVCGAANGVLLLAEQTESARQKPAPATEAPKKAKKSAPMEAPAPQMERDDAKADAFGDGPERAGTRKMGGQVIRSKDE